MASITSSDPTTTAAVFDSDQPQIAVADRPAQGRVARMANAQFQPTLAQPKTM